MFSKTSEHALRTMAYLALHPDESLTTRKIAEVTLVPPGYLAKVLHALCRAGLVSGQTGRGGGHRLTRPAEEITLLEIVNAVNPIRRITACPLGVEDHGELCPVHQKLNRAIAMIEEELGNSRLSELVADPCGAPLCDLSASRAGGVVTKKD